MTNNLLLKQLDEFRRVEDGSIIQGATHTSKILNHRYRNQIIMKAYSDLRDIKNIDSIACCGTSGLIVVPQIAELLKKNIIIVRKKDESAYSEFKVEGTPARNYIIIDDLICSGSTIKNILKNIKEETPRAKCKGVYCYMPDECSYRRHPEYCNKDLGIDYLR